MKNRLLKKMLVGTLVASTIISMAACSKAGTKDSSNEQVTISFYTTVPGKDEQYEELCKEFMEKNPDIKVDYIAYDSSEKQKWMTLYGSGEAPTVSLMDPVDIQENSENLLAYNEESDSWISKVDANYLGVMKGEDGQIYGIPNSVQAMGLIYNKTTIEKATGETFDPSTIKTNTDLEALCEKIQAGGVSPIMFTGVDWSLGSHYLSQVFTGIRGNEKEQEAFINEMKAGNVDLNTDAAWNGIIDTFDIIAKYNYNSKDPLVGNTDIDGQALANGSVSMWFMGDWGWTYIESIANSEDEYGIMPLPMNSDSSDPINTQLGVFPSKGYCVDKSQNTEAQQEAGKRLVEYLCFGNQQAMADLLGVALPYTDADVTYSSPIVQSTQSHIQSGATYNTYAFSMLLPSDFWSENGATMQKYLVGNIDRDAAADLIEVYWKNQK